MVVLDAAEEIVVFAAVCEKVRVGWTRGEAKVKAMREWLRVCCCCAYRDRLRGRRDGGGHYNRACSESERDICRRDAIAH